jgi:hypothetical protein
MQELLIKEKKGENLKKKKGSKGKKRDKTKITQVVVQRVPIETTALD